ncbi:MAG: hypothetical protein WDA02_03900 [Saccharofermentanales bacterium]
MKKHLLIILALVLVIALVAGCAPKTPDPAPTGDETPTGLDAAEITVQVEKEWMAYYQAAVKRITDDNPKVVIKLLEIGSLDHLGILDETDATNPDVADVFALPADRLTGLSDKDLLAAIDAPKLAARLGGWTDFDAGLGGLFKLNGEYLAFPYNIETLIVFANAKNAADQGFDLSKPLNEEDIEDVANVLIPVFNAWFGVAMTNAGDIALLKEEGGGFVSDLTTPWAELDANKKSVLEDIFGYWEWNYDHNTALFDSSAAWGYIDEQFASGQKGVFRIDGPWETGGMKDKTNGGQDLAVLPIGYMTVSGKPLSQWQGGWGLAVNPRIEEDKAKMALAEAMIGEIVNPKYAVELFQAAGKILENVTAETYQASDLDEIDKKVIAAVIDSFHVSPGRPLFKEFGPVWDTWQNAILSWNSVVPANAEEAYGQLKAAFDAMMADLK